MKSLISLAVMFLLTLPMSFAQVGRNTAERAANRNQIHKGRQSLEQDIQELNAYTTKAKALQAAFSNKNADQVRALKAQILADMQREIQQTKAKLGQANNEVKQSKSEVRSDNREVRRSRRDLATGRDNKRDDARDLARDKHNRRDDRRDVRDDQRDRGQLGQRLANQEKIYNALKAVTFNVNAPVTDKVAANRALINDFAKTMEADIAQTKSEIGEDKREVREDRRETRDDARERRERRYQRR